MRYMLLIGLLVAGCATPEQWAKQVIAEYGPYCEKLGYKKDTDAWRQCIQIEDAKSAAVHRRSYLMSPWCFGAFWC